MPRSIPTSFTLSQQAYWKLILHSQKFPHCQITGVFIGKSKLTSSTSEDEEGSSEVTGDSQMKIKDYIPLFHTPILGPMLELALTLIEEYCRKHKMVIMGIASVNELLVDGELCSIAQHVGLKVAEHQPCSCILVLDSNNIDPRKERLALIPYLCHGDEWKKADAEPPLVNQETDFDWEQLSNLLKQDASQNLFDFDDHLEESSNDWLNTKLF